jgi:hypothetical protein
VSAGDSSAEPPKKSRNWRYAVIVVVIALAIGFLIYAFNQSAPRIQPTSTASSQQSSSTNSMTAPECSTSASLPCGVTGGTQGVIVITNASLTVSPSVSPSNGTSGFLSLTIMHTGDFEGDPLTVYMCQPGGAGCSEVLQTTATGQTGTYTTPIYGSFALTRGVKYEVEVNSLYHSTTYPGEGEVDEIEILFIGVTAN